MRSLSRKGWLLSLGRLLALVGFTRGAERTAEEILKAIDAVEMPKLDRAKVRDSKYVQDYLKERNKATEARGVLILELYKSAPDNARLPDLMVQRWEGMPPFGSRGDELLKEIDDVLAHTKNAKFKVEGTFAKARAQLIRGQQAQEGKSDLSAVDDFLKLAPKDPRAGQLIYMASMSATDQKAKAAYEDRILKEFPDSMFAGMVKERGTVARQSASRSSWSSTMRPAEPPSR